MRPVGAPDAALRRGGDEQVGERRDVVERMAGLRRPVAAELDPAAAGLEQPAQRRDGRMRQAPCDRDGPHVVDHDVDRQAPQAGREVQERLRAGVELHVPAQWRDAAGEGLQQFDGGGAADHVATHAADAGVVHAAQVGIGGGLVDHDDAAASRRAELRHGVQRATVVRAVDARLHDHDAIQAERLAHHLVVGQRGLDRRVAAARVQRIAIRRTDDVDVAVARAGWREAGGGGGIDSRVLHDGFQSSRATRQALVA